MAGSVQSIWNLVIDGPLDGSMNMALDEVLMLQKSPVPVLRFYQWIQPTVSIGMAQNVSRHIREDTCRKLDIPVVRRLTGGKAVLHDRELTYSITGPVTVRPFSSNLLDTYCEIGNAFCMGLEKLGVHAMLAERNSPPLKGTVSSCFAAPSAYEITVHGKKLLGSAQKRSQDTVLQHGSLLIEYTASDWQTVMQRSPDNAEDLATDLKSHLNPMPSVEQIQRAICDGFRRSFGIHFRQIMYTEKNMKLAHVLAAEKYSNLIDRLDKNLQ